MGIWAPNCAEWVVVQYATAKIGAILVNVNPAYRTHELEYVLRESGTRLLFSASAFKTSDYVAMVEEVSGDIDALERTIFLDRPEWDELCAGEPDRDAIAARMATLSFDDPINIQYTSGTTGFPKGATLSHHNILNNGFFVTELLGLTEHDVTCLPVPFYHCFGMVMGNLGTLAHGGCVVIPAPSFEPRRDARGGRRGGRHLAVRRPDDVHRDARTARTSPRSTWARCAPGSWPARRARSRS